MNFNSLQLYMYLGTYSEPLFALKTSPQILKQCIW